MTEVQNPKQRLRVVFGLSGAMRYASVLDHGRTWERMLGRAGIPIAYTHGFNPHPRIQFAGGFPVGYSSACERVDLFLNEEAVPDQFLRQVAPHCPVGLTLSDCWPVPLKAQSLQASMLAATYIVRLATSMPAERLRDNINELLAQEHIAATRRKKGRDVSFDLRPLVLDIVPLPSDGKLTCIEMRLKCGAGGSGRPEQVVQALGIAHDGLWIHRAAIAWSDEKGIS